MRSLASELSQAELRERKRLAKLIHDHLQQLIVAAGIEATRRILAAQPHTQVIGLSMHVDPSIDEAMREAGASAYLSKGGELQPLIEAIRGCCGK